MCWRNRRGHKDEPSCNDPRSHACRHTAERLNGTATRDPKACNNSNRERQRTGARCCANRGCPRKRIADDAPNERFYSAKLGRSDCEVGNIARRSFLSSWDVDLDGSSFFIQWACGADVASRAYALVRYSSRNQYGSGFRYTQAHHDDRDLFLVDWAEHRGGSCGRHPRPQPDRVVHLRHHLFAFARRLVAAGAAQPSELVWAD